MNEEDYSPFPAPGRWVEWRCRRAVWMSVRPWYGANNVVFDALDTYRMFVLRFWFPFLCWDIKFKEKGIHGYIGWKPIPVHADPAFYWRELRVARKAVEKGERFVQLSARGGVGRRS